VRQGISLRLSFGEGLPAAWGDRIQLQQVIINLVINGMQAMATGVGTKDLIVHTGRAEDGGLQVAVEDTGVGIEPERLAQVFDAFHTTKPNGMGLGLAISRSIIEAHHGAISAARTAMGGMRFQFTIPPAEG
jgi:signal transduction histidine kinase